jgi:predicted nucleic acid-binding protein
VICIDTSILIAAARNRAPMTEFLRDYMDEDVFVPAMAAAEFLVGVYGTKSPRLRLNAERFYTDYVRPMVEGFDEPQAHRLAVIICETKSKGKTIKPYDSAIAAAAMELGAEVLTLDGDFDHIDGLTVLKP